MLPPDNHLHSQWSWDAIAGDMQGTCARALDLGLTTVAFTEHVDFVRPLVSAADLAAGRADVNDSLVRRIAQRTAEDGRLDPPALDVAGYLACVQECRDRYPDLRILTGVEIGEAHWFAAETASLLAAGPFDRVLGSQHCVAVDAVPYVVPDAYTALPAEEVFRRYLAELLSLVESTANFAVLAHIDYVVRYRPTDAGAPDQADFEDEHRAVLRALARSGRALEVNTTLAFNAEVVRWWHQEGGEAVSFGSDAHAPSSVARRFADMACMVEGAGFRPGRDASDFWVRR